MPRKGKSEVDRWFLWLMALSVAGLFSTCCYLYADNKELNRVHAETLANCEKEIIKASREFTKYMLLKDSITTAQQHELNKLNKKIKR